MTKRALGLIMFVVGSSCLLLAETRTDQTETSIRLARSLYEVYGDAAFQGQALYMGSESCLLCHSGPHAVRNRDTSGWRDSFHARPFKSVENDDFSLVVGKGIVADSNRNGIDDFKDGLDFNQLSQTAFDGFKPNAPVLSYSDSSGYTVTIGEVSYRVTFAWGGNGLYKQRYVTKIPVTDRVSGLSSGTYLLPIQYNETTREWVSYHPENWYSENGDPIFTSQARSSTAAGKGRSFDRLCAGCHFTGTTVRQDRGEWVAKAALAILIPPNDPTYIDYDGDGYFEMTHVGCEGCHGPGSLHALRGGDPDYIVNPSLDLEPAAADEVCGSCHVRGSSRRGTLGYPWDETEDHGYVLGSDLGDFLDPAPGLWPDGKTSKKHHQQWQDYQWSTGHRMSSVTCSECHDLHSAGLHALRPYIDQETASGRIRIMTREKDNTLCLACHAEKGEFAAISKGMVADYSKNEKVIARVVEAHTHHPYAPERWLGLSRCTRCHMPVTATSAVPYDIHSHTFEVVPPERTLEFQPEGGMPNACSVSCHRGIFKIISPNPRDSSIIDWTEESDVSLAQWLLEYFGPGGEWWDTSITAGTRSRSRSSVRGESHQVQSP